MSKWIVLGIGSTGVVGASVGSYFLLKPTTETFRVKYKNALLSKEGDSSIWDSRHASLSGKTPIYKKLKEAVTNHSSSDLSKRLHKEACLEIYEMPIDEEKYFSDFESYCTKNMRDLIAPKTFITDPKSTATEWDKKLNSLKELGSDKLETLNSALKTLKNAIGSASPSETHRETLKGWCDNMKTKIFVGGNDAGFQNFRDYCAK
ncbi:hypothetical protein MHC_01410 [Mycoplasma haemocanis str. Illinois]|uniref:Uncharacterized protein n=1 Tax=Mycoplasma haemocanis (strain Illinois) TaxID=1111676 RepID=H6N676_MYCHN|nr:hypothetical protein [Mycoplasma haemocanis]AEW45148.1 hypothetical protein MHC_01410 [Mycoplasma haemocanis str. Illinois]